MNAEFQWWLLILGMVIGGALVYLVLADIRSDDDDAEWLGDGPAPDDAEAADPPWPPAVPPIGPDATGGLPDPTTAAADGSDPGPARQPGPPTD